MHLFLQFFWSFFIFNFRYYTIVAYFHLNSNRFLTTMSAVSGIKSKNFVNYNQIKVGVCQVPVTADKLFNIEHVRGVITTACQVPCDMIVLPEIWNSPYATVSFPIYAEVLPSIGEQPKPIDSPSSTMMCEQAKKFGVYIIGGSIPEREIDSVTGEERIYNTCLVINPNGEIVGKFRKVHLFDIDVPGKIKFKESDSLTSGNDVCIVDTPWGLVGVGICYDIRFPELALIMRARGCKILIYPGAFNMITGPAHWELLSRGGDIIYFCLQHYLSL